MAAWLVVALVVGLLVGRMIRARDRQVPPVDGGAPGGPAVSGGRSPRTAGRGRLRRH